MPKTRLEKIAAIEAEQSKLAEQRKTLLEAERAQARKDRTRRLCQRGGLLEKMLPDTIPLSDEQFQTFLEKTVANDFGRRTLEKFTAQNATTTTEPQGEGAAQTDTAAAADKPTGTAAQPSQNHNQKPHHTAQNGGTRTPQNGTTTPSH